jgi:AcrR family transcriptional regulator
MVYRPTEKTKAHRDAQMQKLLQTATKLVAEGGFKLLTISKIAESAGVATGTVYKYFSNKAELCVQVFKQATEKEIEQVHNAVFSDDCETNKERLLKGIDVFSRRAIQGRQLAFALIAEPVEPEVDAERLIYREAYAKIFSELIDQGIKTKEFPKQDISISAAALVGALSEALVGPLNIPMPNKNSKASVNIQDAKQQTELIQSIQQFCVRAITGS